MMTRPSEAKGYLHRLRRPLAPLIQSIKPARACAPSRQPIGLAAVAGALSEWDDIDDAVDEIYAQRDRATDRPAPDPAPPLFCFDTDILSAALRREPPLAAPPGSP